MVYVYCYYSLHDNFASDHHEHYCSQLNGPFFTKLLHNSQRVIGCLSIHTVPVVSIWLRDQGQGQRSRYISVSSFHFLFLVTCARLIWPHSGFQSTSKSRIVLYLEAIDCRCRSGYYQLRQLRQAVRCSSVDATRTMVQAFIISRLDWCNSLYGMTTDESMRRLQPVQSSSKRNSQTNL